MDFDLLVLYHILPNSTQLGQILLTMPGHFPLLVVFYHWSPGASTHKLVTNLVLFTLSHLASLPDLVSHANGSSRLRFTTSVFLVTTYGERVYRGLDWFIGIIPQGLKKIT